jgi:hypothetical protein
MIIIKILIVLMLLGLFKVINDILFDSGILQRY